MMPETLVQTAWCCKSVWLHAFSLAWSSLDRSAPVAQLWTQALRLVDMASMSFCPCKVKHGTNMHVNLAFLTIFYHMSQQAEHATHETINRGQHVV